MLQSEAESIESVETTCAKRSRRWAFTTTNLTALREIKEQNVCVYLGPAENLQSGTGHRHGIIIAAKDESAEENPISKMRASKILTLLGIEHSKYLSPVRVFNAWIGYMYKNGPEEVPTALKNLMKNGAKNSQKGRTNFYENIAKEVSQMFDSKPSMNRFMEELFKRDFTFPEGLAKRSYNIIAWGKSNKLLNTFAIMKSKHSVLPDMPVQVAYDVCKQIFASAANVRWDGRSLTSLEFQILICVLGIECRDNLTDGIQLSPHFCLYGAAGKGKTLLGQILFPPEHASTLTNDSKGVGQLSLRHRHKLLKIDDAGESFFNDSGLTATVKTCTAEWSAKTHGSRQDNKATGVFLTTNHQTPLREMAGKPYSSMHKIIHT